MCRWPDTDHNISIHGQNSAACNHNNIGKIRIRQACALGRPRFHIQPTAQFNQARHNTGQKCYAVLPESGIFQNGNIHVYRSLRQNTQDGGSSLPPECFTSFRCVGFDVANQLLIHELLDAHIA
jgi:hypothetical protein